jgi:hypothetical protein
VSWSAGPLDGRAASCADLPAGRNWAVVGRPTGLPTRGNKKSLPIGKLSLSFEKGTLELLLFRLRVEFLLNFFDIYVLNNRLEVLNLQGLTSYR